MCTVSFVVSNGQTIITSNRDEKVLRESAFEPKNYSINNKNIIFPKDSKAGGTWFAVSEEGTVVVLLNGASEKHQIKANYRKSRGLIVLELIATYSPILEWESIDLDGIEPFTIILFQDEKLYQLRWNDIEKETKSLDTTQNHIWSSATLYDATIREKRAHWFFDFMTSKDNFEPNDLFHFHRYTENQNQDHGLIINRDNVLKTVSITQTVIKKKKVEILYADLMAKTEFSNAFITV
jgi:uncharacterized protein with NRDE domain